MSWLDSAAYDNWQLASPEDDLVEVAIAGMERECGSCEFYDGVCECPAIVEKVRTIFPSTFQTVGGEPAITGVCVSNKLNDCEHWNISNAERKKLEERDE